MILAFISHIISLQLHIYTYKLLYIYLLFFLYVQCAYRSLWLMLNYNIIKIEFLFLFGIKIEFLLVFVG